MSGCRFANLQGRKDFGENIVRSLISVLEKLLTFANTQEEMQKKMGSSVRHLAAAGLVVNTSQTLALTTESSTPVFIHTTDSHMINT